MTNDELQGSVATYLRCHGVVSKQIKKGLLLSLPLKKTLNQARRWLSQLKNFLLADSERNHS